MSNMGADVKYGWMGWKREGKGVLALGVVLLAVLCWRYALPAQARPPDRASLVAVFADKEIERYEAMLAPTAITLADVGDWSDADQVAMVAAALATVTEPTSLATWKPGFQEYLRDVLGWTDEQIVDAVYAVYGKRAVRLAVAIFEQMGVLK